MWSKHDMKLFKMFLQQINVNDIYYVEQQLQAKDTGNN